jgi:hypothetical protein
MTSSVYTTSTFDFDDIVFKVPPKKEDSKYYFFANSTDGKNVYLQTPKINLCDNINSNIDNVQYIDFLTSNETFIEMMRELDQDIIKHIKHNKDDWFKGKIIEDSFLEHAQTLSLKLKPKSNTDYSMKFRVMKDVRLYDNDKNEMSIADFTQSSNVKCILQFVGVWFTANRWGVSWKVMQMKKGKEQHVTQTYLFTEDEDDIEEDEHESICPPPGYN